MRKVGGVIAERGARIMSGKGKNIAESEGPLEWPTGQVRIAGMRSAFSLEEEMSMIVSALSYVGRADNGDEHSRDLLQAKDLKEGCSVSDQNTMGSSSGHKRLREDEQSENVVVHVTSSNSAETSHSSGVSKRKFSEIENGGAHSEQYSRRTPDSHSSDSGTPWNENPLQQFSDIDATDMFAERFAPTTLALDVLSSAPQETTSFCNELQYFDPVQRQPDQMDTSYTLEQFLWQQPHWSPSAIMGLKLVTW